MNDTISVVGAAAAAPVLKQVNGNHVAEFRLGCDIRRRDERSGEYKSVHTNWFSVEAWGEFAKHIAGSIAKGDVLMVDGRLRIEQWESGEKRGTSVRIRADHIGHSMRLGPTTRDRGTRAHGDDRRGEGHGFRATTPQDDSRGGYAPSEWADPAAAHTFG